MPIIIIRKNDNVILRDSFSQHDISVSDRIFVANLISDERALATPPDKCPVCGLMSTAHPIPGWEDMAAYRILAFPQELMVVTTASEPDMHDMVREFTTGEGANVENILHKHGHIAIVGIRSKTVFDLT